MWQTKKIKGNTFDSIPVGSFFNHSTNERYSMKVKVNNYQYKWLFDSSGHGGAITYIENDLYTELPDKAVNRFTLNSDRQFVLAEQETEDICYHSKLAHGEIFSDLKGNIPWVKIGENSTCALGRVGDVFEFSHDYKVVRLEWSK